MVIWQPQLNQITNDDPAAQGLREIPLDPLQNVSVHVGFLMQASDSYLRTQVDAALTSLIADGTIAKLMQQYHYEGNPGQ
jgi:polar amino acid transport system substrate-binding protein